MDCLHLHLEKIAPSGAESYDTSHAFRARCANPKCKMIFSVVKFAMGVVRPDVVSRDNSGTE